MCVVAGGLVTGCTKKRVAECDELLATIDKIVKCDKLPPESRKSLAESGKTIKGVLEGIDDDARADVVQQIRDTCKTQNKSVVDQYLKLMPECMK